MFALLLLQAGPVPNQLTSFLPILLIFGIFYFIVMRPMQKQRKEQQLMLANLQNGQVVTTNGGIIGTVVALTDDTVTLRIKPDNVRLQIARSAVAALVTEESK